MRTSLWPLSPAPSAVVMLLIVISMPVAALEGPFPPAPAAQISTGTDDACGTPPTPIVALRTLSKYQGDDPTKSRIDPHSEAEYERTMEPVRTLTRRVVKAANAYRASGGRNNNAALCALKDLDAWASLGALSRIENDKAYDTQGKTIAGLALAYLQVREVGLDESKRRRTVAWLAAMADDLARYVSASRGKSARNNHRYWSGLGVAAAGVAADRRELVAWGIESARIGLRQVGADGTLPLELERAERARDYHLYALAPLVLIAEIAAKNGVDLYAENEGALQRLETRVISSLDEPSYFETLTGRRQLAFPGGGGGVPSYRLAWLEPFNARFPSRVGTALLDSKRPVVETGLGGNLTILYKTNTSPR